MTRIEPCAPRGLFARLVFWIVKRKFGKVPTPVAVAAHHKHILKAHVSMERTHLAIGSLDRRLKDLVSLRVATLIGCPF